jgi:transcriptional regulator with XRE-family HTH domain
MLENSLPDPRRITAAKMSAWAVRVFGPDGITEMCKQAGTNPRTFQRFLEDESSPSLRNLRKWYTVLYNAESTLSRHYGDKKRAQG